MEDDEDLEFNTILAWAEAEEKNPTVADAGISEFYLVILAIMIFCLVVYLIFRYRKFASALESMNDPSNIADEEDSAEYPKIDLSESSYETVEETVSEDEKDVPAKKSKGKSNKAKESKVTKEKATKIKAEKAEKTPPTVNLPKSVKAN